MGEFSRGILGLVSALLLATASPLHAMCDATNDDLGGNVFRDYNADGVDAGVNEPPFNNGVTVSAYGSNNALISTVSVAADGTYNFSNIFAANSSIRIEFNNLPSFVKPGSAGSNSGTTVQFHSAPSCTADLAVANPCEYCQDDPDMVASTYVRGDQSSGRGVVFQTSYDVNKGGNTQFASDIDMGSVWGMAHDSVGEAVFSGAFLKRHAGFGPGDHDAIYVTDISGATNSTSIFIEFEAPGIGIDVGDDTTQLARDIGAIGTPSRDIAAYTRVGKQSFGGLEYHGANQTLWVVNMFDRRVYGIANIDPASPPVIGDFLRDADNNLGFAVDTAPTGISCTDGVLRPFAVKVKDGKLYAGATCTGEFVNDVSNVSIHVLVMDLADTDAGFQSILNAPIDQARDKIAFGKDGEWFSWANTDLRTDATGYPRNSPAPLLMDIEFDNDGSMILAVGDRHGHLMAQGEFFPSATNNTLFNGAPDVLGDILRVCNISGTFVMEGQPGCANNNPRPIGEDVAANGNGGPAARGPSGGEYYVGDWGPFDPDHYAETLAGGIAMLPGSDQVAMVSLDPAQFNSGGISWLFNADGTRSGGRNIYTTPNSELPTPSTYGKSGGMGDIEILCDPAPFEIGNRIWIDANLNGVQDPEEAPINGVSVQLFNWNDLNSDGVYQSGELGTDTGVTSTANASGEYYFGPRTGINLGTITLQRNSDYVVLVDNTQAALVSYPIVSPISSVTQATADGESNNGVSSATNTAHDSDGLEGIETNRIIAPITTGGVGDNNHTIDFGFASPVSIGSFVWNDADGDGVQDAGEAGISGAMVTLFQEMAPGVFTQVTADRDGNTFGTGGVIATGAGGVYEFDNLNPGTYKVRVTPPADFEPTPMQDGANNSDTTAADELDSNINTAATGVLAGTYESGEFTLSSGGEPNESTTSNGDGQDGAAGSNTDLSGNMTVDFGFVTPVSIGSFVWEDLDVDGVQDAGEPGISGATVTLFRDTGSGFVQVTTDIDGTTIGTAGALTTGADGLYEFDNLPPGDYRVRVTPPAGFEETPTQDTANNSDTTAADELDSNITSEPVAGTFESGTFSLTSLGEPNESDAAAGDTQDGTAGSNEDLSGNMTVDFGFVAPLSIGSFVWQDTNADGVQDAGEPAISGAAVTLFRDNGAGAFVQVTTDISGATIGTAGALTTAANGLYEFDNLPPGDYRVRVTPPAGFEPTPVQDGANNSDTTAADELDSNIASEPVAGMYESGTFTLSSDDEPNESDAAAGDAQDGTAGGAGDLNGNMTIDFGFIAPVSIGSFVWNDTDGDGVQDAGEAGISGAQVSLYLETAPGVFTQVTSDRDSTVFGTGGVITTGADGLYEFDNLVPGNYKVRVTPPAGYDPTPTQDGANNSDTTAADELDSNINTSATGLTAGTYESGVFTLTSGGEPNESTTNNGDGQDGAAGSNTDLSGNMTVDFGFVTPVSIGSFVWEDLDVDGVQDAGEPALQGATLTLFRETAPGVFTQVTTDIDGVAIGTAGALTTGADGLYEFDNLPPGDYRVRVTPPSGFEPTPVQDGADNSDTLASDELDSNINTTATGLPAGTYESGTFSVSSLGEPNESDAAAGDTQDGTAGSNEDLSGNMTVDFGFVAPMSIGSFVWQDTNADGVQDAGEPAISGATVTLFRDNGAGTFVQVTTDISGATIGTAGALTTAANGLYEFDNLPPGDYRVRVTPPAGFEPTPVQDGANNSDTLASDELDSNINTAATGVPAGTYESGTFTLSSDDEPNESDAAAGDAQDGTQGGAGDLNGNMTIDFGFIAPVSIGSFVWNDTDGDGVQDAGEAGISGAQVSLYLETAPGVFTQVTSDRDSNVFGTGGVITTGADGLYEFDNLVPGNYKVRVTPPAGFDPTPTQDGANNSDTTAADELDSNINMAATGVPAGTYESGEFTLSSGGEPNESTTNNGDGQDGTAGSNTNQSGNMTVDFGFVTPVSIGSFVWEDLDVDGVQDAGEPALQGATVTLFRETAPGVFTQVTTDIDGATIGTACALTTGADGLYEFDNLPPGDYRVRVTPPSGFEPTPVQDGAANSDTLASDELDSNINTAATGLAAGTYESGTFTLSSLGEPNESDAAAGDTQDGKAGGNEDLSGNMTVDFGFVAPMSIGSFVWQDTDADGVQDAGEPAISGATVTLFRDNGTGTFVQVTTDISGTTIGTAGALTTGVNGLYEFDNLPPGDYRVRVTPPTGFEPTPVQDGANNSDTLASDELDSNINTSATGVPAGTYESGTFTLSSDDEPNESDAAAGDAQDGTQGGAGDLNGNMTIDFGFIAPVSIGSFVWNDTDGDGVQDAGEAGISGAQVSLYLETAPGVFTQVTSDRDSNVFGTAGVITTGADGLYEFDNLVPGNYKVRVTPPAGFDPTPTQDGANNSDTTAADELDSNINTSATGVPAGTYESGEFLLTSGGEPQEADTAAGDTQDGTAGSNTDLSGNMTVDFGFVTPVSIGSFVWEDLDIDGVQDAGEPGISGATVTLFRDNGTGFVQVTTDIDGATIGTAGALTAGADGLYEFDNLPPGDYRVRVTPPAGFEETPTQDTAANSDTLASDELDSNIASEPVAGTFESATFTLTSLGEPNESDAAAGDTQDGTAGSNEDISGNMTVDFGFVAPMSIGSFVWIDSNGDGVQQTTEPPLAGVSVALLVDNGGTFVPATDISGGPVISIVTSADGVYRFENLPSGDYVIQVTPSGVVFPSPVQTSADNDNSEGDSNIASEPTVGTYQSGMFTLDSFNEPVEADTQRGDTEGTSGGFTDLNGNMTIDFGFVEPAQLGNYVWLDVDMDGVQDASEDGISNVTVNLYEDSNRDGVIDGAEATTPVATAVTGPNGEYLFINLQPGVAYQTGVDVTTLPSGLVQTFDEGDGLGATDSLSATIVLAPAEFHDTADFGYAPPVGLGAVGDTIWVDADDDGVQDPGEPGIAGVEVSITPSPDVDLGAGLGVAITTVTDENGQYLFPNLPLDKPYIVEVNTTTLPTGYTSGPSGLGDPDVRDGTGSAPDDQTTVVLTTETPINLDLDFGYLPPDAQNNSVGDTLWIDIDRDGNGPAGAGDGSDGNEQPLPGVTVSLIDFGSGTVIATTTTNADGMYLFTGVPDGLYQVRVTDQNNLLVGMEQTADGDDPANPGAFVPMTPNASLVDLDSAGTNDSPEIDLGQDFGYVDSSTLGGNGAIGDTIFFDSNNSGGPDSGEGIEGVTVRLYAPGPDGVIGGGDDVLIAVTTTDGNGNYLFTGLDTSDTGPNPGTEYHVEVDTSSLPNGGTGWTNTVDPDTTGTGDSQSVTPLTNAAPIDLDQDFGYVGGDNVIRGTVWPDTDGDGTQEESGSFGGVTIELRDEDGNVISSTTTDANGNYEFPNLADGIYIVVVTDEENVLNGFTHTDSPNGSTDTSDQTSKDDTGYTVDLDSTGVSLDPVVDETGDFGYRPVITNPISLGFFQAQASGQGVDVVWRTQTEVGNLGFYLYGQIDGEWVRLQGAPILGGGDSIEVQEYSLRLQTTVRQFALSDVDLHGQETLHGPFELGRMYGSVSERNSIEWKAEQRESEVKREVREQQKLIQQSVRSNKLMHRNGLRY